MAVVAYVRYGAFENRRPAWSTLCILRPDPTSGAFRDLTPRGLGLTGVVAYGTIGL